MYKNQKIAVVVPAHNEELLITRVIDTMPDFVDHIIIVDDTSKDRTSEVVAARAKTNPKVVLIRHEVNQGVGGAIATGYKWARDHDVDAAAVMAGDAQMDPADLPALLDPVVAGLCDYSKGNRLVTGEAFKKIPKVRYFGNSALSLLTKIASGYWHVADSQTGYTVINKQALHAINWDLMFKRYGQPNDLLVTLNVNNFRVRDVPVAPVYNIGEKSGIKVRKVLFTISWLLVKLFLWRLKEKYIIRDFHPLVFFYAFGALLFFVGALLFARLLAFWYIDGAIPQINFLTCMFCGIMGVQFTLFAMWFDMESNKHLR
ncbi:MAG: glycosyltransferase family 2 protein [Bdellovibrionales bacterium]|nr:glycosyltransferase family 2 protein [Bdellovibrionales bacterium]